MVEAVLRAVERLRGDLRRRALEAVVADGAYSEAMAHWGLDGSTKVLDRASVRQVSSEQGARWAGRRVAIALAESVATAPVRSLLLPFLRGARSVRARPPRRQRAVPQLVGEALSEQGLDCTIELDEDGERWLGRVLNTGVDQVVAFGSDERVERARSAARAAGVAFTGHGHGMGVAWVDGVVSDEDVHRIAWDFCAYDGFGCLSPAMLWVTGDAQVARSLAERLAAAMAHWEREVARGPLDRVRAARERAWRAAAAAASEWFSGKDAWFVASLAEEASDAISSIGGRTVVVRAGTPDGVLAWMRERARWLTTIAVDARARSLLEGARARDALEWSALRARVVRPGWMQRPPLDGEADPR